MLDGVNLHAPLAERGGALDLLHVVDMRRDRRLVGQIDALENVAGVRRGRLDGERDLGVPVWRAEPLTDFGFAHRGLLETGHGGCNRFCAGLATWLASRSARVGGKSSLAPRPRLQEEATRPLLTFDMSSWSYLLGEKFLSISLVF
jgi:hypothetical protein